MVSHVFRYLNQSEVHHMKSIRRLYWSGSYDVERHRQDRAGHTAHKYMSWPLESMWRR